MKYAHPGLIIYIVTMGNTIKEHKIYHTNGRLYKHYYSKNKLLHGKLIEYYNNGCVSYISNNVNGKLHSDSTMYHRNGNLISVETFYNGKLTNYIYYYQNGIPHYIYTSNDKEHHRLKYFDNGNLMHNIYSNEFTDIRKSYDHDGNIKEYVVISRSHNMINEYNLQHKLHARYVAGELCEYFVQIHKYRTISRYYDIYPTDDIHIIHSIMILQKRFRQKIYNRILDVLNVVIKVDALSKLVLLYLKN